MGKASKLYKVFSHCSFVLSAFPYNLQNWKIKSKTVNAPPHVNPKPTKTAQQQNPKTQSIDPHLRTFIENSKKG